MMVKVKEGYFPREFGPDGRPEIPDEAYLVVHQDELNAWAALPDGDGTPLRCRVVWPGTPEHEAIAAGRTHD